VVEVDAVISGLRSDGVATEAASRLMRALQEDESIAELSSLALRLFTVYPALVRTSRQEYSELG